jgi:hypothetical protein
MAIAVAWLSSCSAHRGDAAPPSATGPAPSVRSFAPYQGPLAPSTPPTGVSHVVDNSRTLVIALVKDFRTSTATITLWTRQTTDSPWTSKDSWAAVIGRSGSAWGIGLHGAGAPADSVLHSKSPENLKREGDGKSPAGVFAIDHVYGYAAAAITDMPYQPVDSNWRCVDDPASPAYTKILSSDGMQGWISEEAMKRDDELYELVVNTVHNPAAVPQSGSCIFLHVWRNAESGTAGCTAMPLANLRNLVSKLNPADRPLFVLLPAAVYMTWQEAWHLPAFSL